MFLRSGHWKLLLQYQAEGGWITGLCPDPNLDEEWLNLCQEDYLNGTQRKKWGHELTDKAHQALEELRARSDSHK